MIVQSLVGILVAAMLALPFPSNIAHANLIQNPGFETGNFSGWTQSGHLGFTSVPTSPFYVRSGTFGAFFGPIGSDGFLSQTFATGPGDAYIVAFSILLSTAKAGLGIALWVQWSRKGQHAE